MTEHDTCEEQALVWFTRGLDAPLSADQQQAFLDWLDASPANAEAYARVENLCTNRLRPLQIGRAHV